MPFVCEYCNKKFRCNSNLNIHLNKNTKCYESPKKKVYSYTFECEYCMKTFKRKDYLKNHLDKNHQEEIEMKIKEKMMKEIMVEQFEENMESMKEEFLNQISFLKNELKESIENNPKSVINNVNNVTNNTNNTNCSINNGNMLNVQNPQIFVKAYSQDNDSYITEEFLDKCVKNPYNGILELTKSVNFNEKHPENYNMYMNNKKRKEICFYDNKKWVKRDLKSALNYIYNTQCDRIGEHMDSNPDKFGNDIPFYDNMLHIIMDVTNHDSKMKTDKQYRNFVNNLIRTIEDNSYKVKEAIRKKEIKMGNKLIDIVYKTNGVATCVPLYLEPTPIT